MPDAKDINNRLYKVSSLTKAGANELHDLTQKTQATMQKFKNQFEDLTNRMVSLKDAVDRTASQISDLQLPGKRLEENVTVKDKPNGADLFTTPGNP